MQRLEVLANAPVRIPPRRGTAKGGKPDVLEGALPSYAKEIDCTTEKSKEERVHRNPWNLWHTSCLDEEALLEP